MPHTYFYTAVSLTYQIVGRPEGIRPITGETVIFTCEVEGDLLTWESPAQVIDGGTRTIAINNMVGEVLNDTVSGKLSMSELLCSGRLGAIKCPD